MQHHHHRAIEQRQRLNSLDFVTLEAVTLLIGDVCAG